MTDECDSDLDDDDFEKFIEAIEALELADDSSGEMKAVASLDVQRGHQPQGLKRGFLSDSNSRPKKYSNDQSLPPQSLRQGGAFSGNVVERQAVPSSLRQPLPDQGSKPKISRFKQQRCKN